MSVGLVAGPDTVLHSDEVRVPHASVGPRLSCLYLWEKVVINNDGGVAPCCGAFYKEDDFAKLAVRPAGMASTNFKAVWNSLSYQEARRLFRSRTGSEAAQNLICFDCPVTVDWERYKDYLGSAGDPYTYESCYSFNDGFNYFLGRGKKRAGAIAPDDLIELHQVQEGTR